MIFLDNASTTRCLQSVANATRDAMVDEYYFNPSAKYSEGIHMAKKINECKQRLLKILGADSSYSVVFTGSATEANNLVLSSNLSKHKENLISGGEHASVYETAKAYKNQGYNIKEVKLNSFGQIDEQEFKKLMTPNTMMISFILVSNETGAISNLKDIIAHARKINPKVLVHIDAVQAFLKIRLNIKDLDADFVTVSSHKVHGPKGVGALIYKKNQKLNAQILGGGQEDGKRSGTENLPGIIGFITASEEMHANFNENYNSVYNFKTELINKLTTLLNNHSIKFVINSAGENYSPYILSISFIGYKGEVLLRALETEGVLVSTGSACSSRHAGNRTLQSMGKSNEEILGNIRLSFAPDTAKLDPQMVAEKIVKGILKVKK